MRVLIFGLPGSGKTFLAERLVGILGDKVEWFNADKVREEANDWDFTDEGRLRQNQRMLSLCEDAESRGKISIADFVAPFETARKDFSADYNIFVDTIESGRFEDTNKVFQRPDDADYVVKQHRGDIDAKIIAYEIGEKFIVSEYLPDNWVVLKINHEGKTLYKVLAGWSGGYLNGDAWRMNSGITRVEDHETYYSFYGHSGSVYKVWKDRYRLRMNNAGIYNKLKDQFGDAVELMPEDTDWMGLNYE